MSTHHPIPEDLDFRYQDLRGHDFEHDDRKGGDFSGANLQGVNLSCRYLTISRHWEGSVVTGATLSYADLAGQKLDP